jgi:pyruvate dehydrogenase E2 component (dihydrolipoamide acetyltransferase)
VPIEVNLAKLSPTMESGQIVKWNVKVGDAVKEGDVLAEVQTDKAVMNMESYDDGIVAVIDAKEGEDIALGQRVMVLAKKGEDPAEVAKQAGSGAKAQAKAANVAKEPVAAEDGAKLAKRPAGAARSNGHETREPAQDGGRVKASPLARKVAMAAGIELGSIRGTGPGGRIVRDDVTAAIASTEQEDDRQVSAPSGPPPGQGRESRRIPHSRMRQTIAQRMVEAKQAVPEIHVTVEIRMDRVMAARERMNETLAKEKIKLSVGDFITKAVALALRAHPAVNASWESDAIVERGNVNIGIAVALDGGLIVPVLADADELGLREIRLGTQALAEAARANKLTAKQMMGGTFTISNLGMYGVKQFDAILNPPEVGILAVGATEQRPVVENGQLVAGWLMSVTLTADHRAVDGATAAEFLRTLKGLLEEPAAMLL